MQPLYRFGESKSHSQFQNRHPPAQLINIYIILVMGRAQAQALKKVRAGALKVKLEPRPFKKVKA